MVATRALGYGQTKAVGQKRRALGLTYRTNQLDNNGKAFPFRLARYRVQDSKPYCG